MCNIGSRFPLLVSVTGYAGAPHTKVNLFLLACLFLALKINPGLISTSLCCAFHRLRGQTETNTPCNTSHYTHTTPTHMLHIPPTLYAPHMPITHTQYTPHPTLQHYPPYTLHSNPHTISHSTHYTQPHILHTHHPTHIRPHTTHVHYMHT